MGLEFGLDPSFHLQLLAWPFRIRYVIPLSKLTLLRDALALNGRMVGFAPVLRAFAGEDLTGVVAASSSRHMEETFRFEAPFVRVTKGFSFSSVYIVPVA